MAVYGRRNILKWALFGGGAAISGIIGRNSPPAVGTIGISQSPPTPTKEIPPLETLNFETVTLDASGFVIARNRKTANYYRENLPDNTPINMIAIPAGNFIMGTPEGEKGDFTGADKPPHPVSVKDFYMSQHPITQKQWRQVANLPRVDRDLNPDPSHFKGDDLPVDSVSWHDAVEFCARLSKFTGRSYSLPAEALWEYACRAGTTTPFYFGVTMTSQYANYYAIKSPYAVERESEFRAKTTPVGVFPPNNFGLHDLHGGIYEWCADGWHRNYENAPGDGSVWQVEPNSTGNRYRVLRGGGWGSEARECRSASRAQFGPDNRYSVLGFRIVSI